MDLLWPEESGQKVGNRLSVALSTLRTALDPDEPAPSNHFVTSDRETVALNREHVDVDVEAFLRDAAAGLAPHQSGDVRRG